MGKKRAKQFFQKHTNSARKICWGKKSSQRSAKILFLFSHEYRDQKMGGGKTRETIYPENQQIVRANNIWKKIFAKNCETSFFI